MSLIFTDNTRGFTRVAVVVSKKTEKLAVNRNRIRRRVYEVIRKNFEYLPKKKDYIIVVFSNSILKMPFDELEKTVGELVEATKGMI